MITIVAEKPDVGNKIAAALDHIDLNDGKRVEFSSLKTNEKAKMVKLEEYIDTLKSNNVAFVVGAISKGDVNIDYMTDTISISSFPLTAGIVCSKICTAFEKCWDVI